MESKQFSENTPTQSELLKKKSWVECFTEKNLIDKAPDRELPVPKK